MNYSRRNAQDAYDTLCRIYGEHNAGRLMQIHGACMPVVSAMALAMRNSEKAVAAAKAYRCLVSVPGAFQRLKIASGQDGRVTRLIESVIRDHNDMHFRKDWVIEQAVSVVLALIDRKGV